ncbi:MAG TPA: ABC transporter permease [Anaeromyxobacteraceae bacterium]|nr:ABC transporter permease [Anaeromyxobacteraceae bacterium]
MTPLRILAIAGRALLRNKLRSFLTMLGVIIGVGAVIAMTAIGSGAAARVQATFEQMGSNMLVVRSGSSQSGGARGGAGSQPTLTWSDLEALRALPTIRYAAPQLSAPAQVMGEGQNWATSVQGTTPEYFSIRNWQIASGAFFDEGDDAAGAKVAVVGKTVALNLFGPFTNPVGQVIRVGHVPFEIIGVTAPKGQSGFGQDQDDVVFIPARTFRAKLQGGLQQYIAGSIVLSSVTSDASTEAQSQIEALLRARHRIAQGAPDDFTVRNLSEMAAAQQEGASTMTSLLAGIALVSLVVGGIGIMNIMLVSVTERTREIGLRMAVGAKPRSILTQFLVEAVTLSVAGGIVGTAAGLGAAGYLVRRFDWPMLVQPQIIAAAVVFSGIVGVAFGMWPALKASRLDPIQALRYE